jgi:light-regulated signal transduction histidine kinase (bacteriophytochrome)
LRRDGTEFPVELTLTTGLHGGKRFFAAIVRDVSARNLADRRLREAMADLERSNAELQQFASIASHDLHEPLRIVAGYLDLLRRRYAEQLDEQAHVFIEHAESAVARMQLLIDDLLRYARAGSEAARAELVDLALVVGEVLETLAPTVADTHADVTVHELPAVTGDASLLRQVLQNLVVNALKFTRDDERPRIDISAKRLPAAWEISVVDGGIGVDPEASERIFEMFGRGRGTGRGRAGNGIGLAICKRAIEAHGGAIRVDPGDDGGSAFRFVLPDQDVAA